MVDLERAQVRRVTTAELPRVIDVVARAFQNDPMMAHVYPDEEKRALVAPRIYRLWISPGLDNGQVYGVGDPVEGVALWELPNQRKPAFTQYLRAEMLRVLFSSGLIPFIRFRGTFSRIKAMHKKHAPRPHYYLRLLAVAPEAQGRGIASRLLRPFLAKADERSLGAYLETMNPGNVALYEHFGFACVDQYQVPKTGLTVWALYRAPRA